MSFTNLYYKRAVATPSACYVCYKPTTTVLATSNTTDFIYTCDGHLADPGFASQIGDAETGGVGRGGLKKLALNTEEIAKVKEEWEEKQEKKQLAANEKEKAVKEKGKANEEGGDMKAANLKDGSKYKAPPGESLNPSTPSTPMHQRYTLHPNLFTMRLAEHRKRRQMSQAKALAPRLPGVPRGGL